MNRFATVVADTYREVERLGAELAKAQDVAENAENAENALTAAQTRLRAAKSDLRHEVRTPTAFVVGELVVAVVYQDSNLTTLVAPLAPAFESKPKEAQ